MVVRAPDTPWPAGWVEVVDTEVIVDVVDADADEEVVDTEVVDLGGPCGGSTLISPATFPVAAAKSASPL